jgi:hypothetical protein
MRGRNSGHAGRVQPTRPVAWAKAILEWVIRVVAVRVGTQVFAYNGYLTGRIRADVEGTEVMLDVPGYGELLRIFPQDRIAHIRAKDNDVVTYRGFVLGGLSISVLQRTSNRFLGDSAALGEIALSEITDNVTRAKPTLRRVA